MRIREFLLQAPACHTPSADELFDPLDSFRSRKRLEFLKAVAEGVLRYETVPCLCGGTVFDVLTTVDRHSLPQFTNLCVRCGLVVNTPRLDRQSYDWFYRSGLYRDLYSGERAAQDVYPTTSGGYAGEIVSFLEAHDPHIATRRRFLEVGCNTGYTLFGLRQRGFAVAGIEPDERACAAGNAHGLNIQCGSIEDTTGRHDFDVVVLTETFEHMADPGAVLQRIRTFLKPDGLLYISHVGLLHTWDNIMKFSQVGHPYNYTLGTLAMVCHANGFELVRGIEQIVAIFTPTGAQGSMIPDQRQYHAVRDKFVTIEARNATAAYRRRQRLFTALRAARAKSATIDRCVWLALSIRRHLRT